MRKGLLLKFSLLSASLLVASAPAINANIPAMAEAFPTIPLSMVEMLTTIPSMFLMLSVLISSFIAKKIGYKQTISLGLMIVAISGIIPIFIDNFYIILLSRACLGFGIGLFNSLLVSMISYFYDGDERSSIIGLQSACEGLGGMGITFIAGQLLRISWQSSFYAYFMAVPVVVLFVLFVPNGIIEAEYFIDCGVHYFSDCLTLAKDNSISDTKNISLALQGYNFGKGYITWAIEHFDGYTKANAKVFSDQKKAELQTDVYGDPNYVAHVLQYYHLGNGDIVAIAKSQVGNVGGRPYWSWYGFDSHVEWCACFVSWCANESGQLNITVPKFSRVEDGIKWYKDNGSWQDENYIPKSGDLIFFDWNNDNDPDHVGIVEKVEKGYIYTIEGHSRDECKEKQYKLTSLIIYGYGI